jgi:hypothetical protein
MVDSDKETARPMRLDSALGIVAFAWPALERRMPCGRSETWFEVRVPAGSVAWPDMDMDVDMDMIVANRHHTHFV